MALGLQGAAWAADEVKTLSTGAGIEARGFHEGYSLKLTFAERLGPYVALVNVTIYSKARGRVVGAKRVGPWFLVDLPPGDYSVVAVNDQGQRTSARFSITGGRQKRVSLSW